MHGRKTAAAAAMVTAVFLAGTGAALAATHHGSHHATRPARPSTSTTSTSSTTGDPCPHMSTTTTSSG